MKSFCILRCCCRCSLYPLQWWTLKWGALPSLKVSGRSISRHKLSLSLKTKYLEFLRAQPSQLLENWSSNMTLIPSQRGQVQRREKVLQRNYFLRHNSWSNRSSNARKEELEKPKRSIFVFSYSIEFLYLRRQWWWLQKWKEGKDKYQSFRVGRKTFFELKYWRYRGKGSISIHWQRTERSWAKKFPQPSWCYWVSSPHPTSLAFLCFVDDAYAVMNPLAIFDFIFQLLLSSNSILPHHSFSLSILLRNRQCF